MSDSDRNQEDVERVLATFRRTATKAGSFLLWAKLLKDFSNDLRSGSHLDEAIQELEREGLIQIDGIRDKIVLTDAGYISLFDA